jgi:drug/metabolite transporter (DMT)-like permease
MFWLLLSIITNTILLLILKSFPKFGIITLQGIVVNYFVAGSTGIILSGIPISVSEIPEQPWAWVPLVLGCLFISIFLLLAKTAQTVGVSVATVANKMSVAIPVVAAIFLYNESVSFWKIAGLIIAIAAVYLTSFTSEKNEIHTKGKLWMPTLIFIGSGIIDALVNHAKRNLVPDNHLAFFLSLCFLTAGCIGIITIIYRRIKFSEKFRAKSLLAGLILGIPNYFSIYGITRALGSHVMESSALYPVNNMGIVALSAIGALLIFKEKFTFINWVGILLALGAIAMIAFM